MGFLDVIKYYPSLSIYNISSGDKALAWIQILPSAVIHATDNPGDPMAVPLLACMTTFIVHVDMC